MKTEITIHETGYSAPRTFVVESSDENWQLIRDILSSDLQGAVFDKTDQTEIHITVRPLQ